jgi:hypothetical protein
MNNKQIKMWKSQKENTTRTGGTTETIRHIIIGMMTDMEIENSDQIKLDITKIGIEMGSRGRTSTIRMGTIIEMEIETKTTKSIKSKMRVQPKTMMES